MMVLDASATIARYHHDEVTPALFQLFDKVEVYGAFAPPFWKVEIANVLQKKVRTGKYDTAERKRLLDDISALDVTIDMQSPDFLWTTTVDLAHRHNLSVYDAIYLECALRNGLPLATLDRQLRLAAEAEGVRTLGL